MISCPTYVSHGLLLLRLLLLVLVLQLVLLRGVQRRIILLRVAVSVVIFTKALIPIEATTAGNALVVPLALCCCSNRATCTPCRLLLYS